MWGWESFFRFKDKGSLWRNKEREASFGANKPSKNHFGHPTVNLNEVSYQLIVVRAELTKDLCVRKSLASNPMFVN